LGVPNKLNFFLCNQPFWLAHYPTKKTFWRLPKMKFSFGRWSESPLVHLFRWKDNHFGQIKCGAIRNIWGKRLRTWGPCENLKRTDQEHEKVQHPHLPSPNDKTMGLSNACSITSLPGQNFYSYICLSPFSNNWGTYSWTIN